MKNTITIPTPSIDTGPTSGAFPQQDAAGYLEEVRARFGRETSHGKGVRGLVDSLLADVIRAVRAMEPTAAAGAAEHVRRSTPPEYVDVVLADADEVSRFVEIEGPGGYSIRVGQELVDQHGYRRIRIRAADLAPNLDSPGRQGMSGEALAAHLRALELRYGPGNEPQRHALGIARADLADRMGS